MTRLPPPLRARQGLGRTFQVPRPLGDLTVFENALVGAMRAAGLRGRAAYSAAYQALEQAGLAETALREAAAISGGGFYHEEDLQRLPAQVKGQMATTRRREEVVLWGPLALILFLSLITCEWLLRKLSNLS